jgi:polyhydroxyalkanoate synthesis regulator phasin
MATSNQAAWKRLFDTVDRTLGSRVNNLAQSEDVATMAALAHRAQTKVGQLGEQASRRILHSLNLPAGSDVNRLLRQIALLEREVRDLRKELEQPPPSLPEASSGPPEAG